jgi:cytochrome c-type biogenesis protein CcmH
MLVVLVGAVGYGTVDEGTPRTVEDRAAAITATLRCPTCRSQSVLESDSSQARSIKTDVVRRLQAGQTEGEIKGYYVSRYGREILLTPDSSGVAGLVWVLPVAGLIVAVAGLAFAFRRWRARDRVEVTDADRVLVEQARRRLT